MYELAIAQPVLDMPEVLWKVRRKRRTPPLSRAPAPTRRLPFTHEQLLSGADC